MVPSQTVVVGLSVRQADPCDSGGTFSIVLGDFAVNDPFELVDQWGPEKVVLVSDRRSGMRGVLVIDNTARGLGKGGTRMSPSR